MKDLKFICAQPDDTYYTWQVHLWLENLREIGYSDKAIVLIFVPNDRIQNSKWNQIMDLYPETEFKFYKDVDRLSDILHIYIPILRPYMLWKYWKEHPEMSDKAVFYYDSDCLLTEKFNVDQFLEDDVCYLSDTNSYINSSYFDSKIHQVLPEKLEEYKTRDVLGELTSIIGISREIAENNKEHSGGAQYLLKNIDSRFWSKVMNDTILIRTYLQKVNREFFKDEDTGFQSWCADMWAVLWNLWLSNKETKVVPELNFAWAPDPIKRLETYTIFHNAGISGDTINGYPCFYKAKYNKGQNPMIDPHLDVILNDVTSQKYCTWYYTNALNSLKHKYKLNY